MAYVGKKCERLSGQYCTYLYRRASTRVYVFFLLVFHLSLSNPGVVRARVTSREILERCLVSLGNVSSAKGVH